ncbi:MAG: hypothetical protein WCG25_08255 [bacterium]
MLNTKQNLSIQATSSGMVDVFYYFDNDNVPLKFKDFINPNKPTYTLNDKQYPTIYL